MAQKELTQAVLDLRGIDLVTPVDLLDKGHSPYAKNFRLYAQQSDDRRVAISSRKGPGYYMNPLQETLSDANTAVLSASTAKVGLSTNIHAQPVTAASTGRITRIDLSVFDVDNATGPLIVEIWSDNNGKPYNLLTTSSILDGDIGSTASYKTARFVNAPLITAGQKYWIVLYIQDDGSNTYTLTTTTSGASAYISNSLLSNIVQQGYALNYRVYVTPDGPFKGGYRFNRDNGDNVTLMAYGTTMYRLDETTHSLVPIVAGLASTATEYDFTNGDNKVFWVNGLNTLRYWNGDPVGTPLTVTNPGADTDTSGWGYTAGTTFTRSTADFNTAPASFRITGTSGTRSMTQNLALTLNHTYKFTFWAKGDTATGSVGVSSNATGIIGAIAPLTTSWKKYELIGTVTTPSTTYFGIYFSTDNGYIDDVSIVDTGAGLISDPDLPTLSQVTMHKDRLFGRAATDPNKIVWSEAPGNPAFDPTGATALTADQQWYNAWLSTSFAYIPRPHNGSPVTGMISFQDSLTIFTQDKKYIFSGYDKGSFNLRESTGAKGALSRRGIVADENSIYFVGDDGFYVFNGSKDTKLSSSINPLFDGCGHKDKITPVVWNNEVRFYMASEGSPVNDTCIIYNKDLQELEYDTDTFVDRALYYNDADDKGQLIELSSLYPGAFNAEQGYHSLGAPIDFEYRLKYDSMGSPAQKKRIRRYYPILQGTDSEFNISLAMDKDFENSPRLQDIMMATNNAKLGTFVLGKDTLGGDTSFKLRRIATSGYAYYWQLRILRKGVNNRVAFIGAQYSYKTKRL